MFQFFLVTSVNPEVLLESSSQSQPARKSRGLQSFNVIEGEARPCIPRDFGRGSVVCVCNSTYCDTVRLTIPSKIASRYHKIVPSASVHLPGISNQLSSKTVSLSQDPSSIQTTNEEENGGGAGLLEDPGLVQIFTSTKTGSRLHKSIVRFNNDPEKPYRRDDLLSHHDDLIAAVGTVVRADPSLISSSSDSSTSRSQKLSSFFDTIRATPTGSNGT